MWFYFILLLTPMFIFGHIAPRQDVCDVTYVVHSYLYYFIALPNFVIMAVGTISLYLQIWINVNKQKRQVLATASTKMSSNKSSLKLTRGLILVIGIFLALYVPIIVCYFLVMVLDNSWFQIIVDLSVLIFYVNNWINPVICFYKMKDFREAFCTLLPILKHLYTRPTLDESTVHAIS